MNWADWTICAIIVLSALISLQRGFVKEALSLAVWFAAIVVSMLFHQNLQVLLADYIQTSSLRQIAAFAILFFITLIVGSMVNHLVAAIVKATGLSGTDRLLGTIFGVLRGAMVVLVILILAPAIVPIEQDSWYQQSVLIPKFLLMETWARDTAAAVISWGSEVWSSRA
jgi:membrane protein required for colicin V production|tara:strand:- start:1915 stop:2421 length:507 start_codon:yes stop_codon:yes gene_type:complete